MTDSHLGHSASAGPATATVVQGWQGEPGTVGTVSVIGLGKIGLPLAAQYADAGWHVIGVDVIGDVVDALNEGRAHFADEPGLVEKIETAHVSGRIEATLSHRDAVQRSDVVVIIVPVMLSRDDQPDYRVIDAATSAVAAGLHPGCLVCYETTLPVGDTRQRFGPMLERGSDLTVGDPDGGFLLAFSPERVFSGRVFSDLASYPKLVGGVDEASADRAEMFYRSVLTSEVRRLSSTEAAEFAKLAETTYRDVNIALANEFARYAERIDVDILEVIAGANTQPFSAIHQPGLGVGGHCIPVYPHFLISRDPDLALIQMGREVNQGQVTRAADQIERIVGDSTLRSVLVLGVTYRDGVKELAYSRGPALIDELVGRGFRVSAFDPLLSEDEIRDCGALPWGWGDRSDAEVIATQTGDPLWHDLDSRWFPNLRAVYDGRNSMSGASVLDGISYVGVGRRGQANSIERDARSSAPVSSE